MVDVDLFVIGAGSGGVACARRAASHGAKVAIAEESRVGGTCVIRGCIPKKLMSYAAHMTALFKVAPAYGWDSSRPSLDFQRLLHNRNKEIARLSGIYVDLLERSGVRFIEGTARVEEWDGDGFMIAVAGERVRAHRVLLAVGAAPYIPPIEGAELAVTSDHLTEEVYPLPRRLAVVGAGYIGLEQSSIFNGLGCQTHLVLRRDLPLFGFENELRAELARQLEESGVQIHARAEARRIEKRGDGLVLHTDKEAIEVDKVLLATGRRPGSKVEVSGLAKLGVETNDVGAVKVDQAFESNVPGLFAIGDCSDHAFGCSPGAPAQELGLGSGEFDLTPVAIAEGRALAERLFNANPTTVDYRHIPTAVFSLPQGATVGLAEDRAIAMGYDVAVYRTRFRPLLYTMADGQEKTMMKLVVDRKTDRVLGCHMVGDDAAEIIQGLAVAVTAGASKAEFDATMALHPTAAEEFVTLYQPVS